MKFHKARKSQIKVYFVDLADTTERIRPGPHWFGTVVQHSENNQFTSKEQVNVFGNNLMRWTTVRC